MTSPEVEMCLVNDFTQKCTIPARYFSLLQAKHGDYITIHCSANFAVVNRIYPRHNMQNVVTASSVVHHGEHLVVGPKTTYCYLENFKVKRAISLKKIKVRVVLKNVIDIVKWQYMPDLEICVKQILMQYGVVTGSCISCSKEYTQIVADIVKIIVLDIYSEESVVGETTEDTELEIDSVTSSAHLEQMSKFRHLHLGGLDRILQDLKSFYTYSFSNAWCSSYSKVLITGPSGCGKTSLVQKLAVDLDSYLIILSEQDLYRMNKSECADLLCMIEKAANIRDYVPCILFIDNLDAVSDKNDEKKKVLYLLLAIIDLASKYRNIPVIGAATSSKFVHAEFKKPARLSKEVYIGIPTYQQRKEILNLMIKDHSSELDISKIAKATAGYVGSDLSLLCLEAKQRAFDTKWENADTPVTTDDFEKALLVVKPSVLKKSRFLTNIQPLHWDDIGGMEDIKKRVIMSIEWPLIHPEVFAKVGLPCPKGVLLYGPPGCCKTTLVRVLATECNATFFSASPAQIYSPYVGDSEKSIVQLFHEARQCAPSIIFLDEIDSLVGRRSYDSKQSGVKEKVLSTLLNEMDGFGVDIESCQGIDEDLLEGDEHRGLSNSKNVIVVGATNRIDLIDDALLRPGRFDSVLYVPPPNVRQREAILKLQTSKMKLQHVDLSWVAERTEGFSGADLKNLCRIVALSAFKSNSSISKAHFETALNLTHPSITKSQLQEYECTAAKYGSTSYN